MKLMNMSDPRIVEISDGWSDFLDKYEEDFPRAATTLSLGQVFLYLLLVYKPPIDELLPIIEFVVNTYDQHQKEVPHGRRVN